MHTRIFQMPFVGRLIVFLFVAGVSFYRLGSGLLTQTDEGFAANRGLSTLIHHSTLLTYDDLDEPQFQKPPLVYWLVAFDYKLLGVNLWAVRLPVAVMSLLLFLLLYLIAREYFGEWVSLICTALLCTVPLVVLHIRTAMLDLPAFFFTMLAVWAFAYGGRNGWMDVLAGMAVSAAVLTKGSVGFLSLPVAVLMGLVRHPDRLRTLRHAGLTAVMAAMPLLVYYLLLPPPYGERLFHAMFSNQHINAAAQVRLSTRWPLLYKPLLEHCGWHVPAAAAGLVLLVVRSVRKPRLLEWLFLLLLVTVPTALGGLKLHHVYARYFLPVYPFVLTLSVWLACESVRSRWSALALIPLAVAAPFVEPVRLAWIPCAAAAIVTMLMQVPGVRCRPERFILFPFLVMAAIVVPPIASGRASVSYRLPDRQAPRPELAELAKHARDLIPVSEPLLVGNGINAHLPMFYSQRAACGYEKWLLFHFRPGDERIILLRTAEILELPYVTVTPIVTSGDWRLARMTVATEAATAGVRGIAVFSRFVPPDAMPETFRLLHVQTHPFARGLIVSHIPDYRAAPVPSARITFTRIRSQTEARLPIPQHAAVKLRPGEALELEFPKRTFCCGMDVEPLSRREGLIGIALQSCDERNAEWRTLYSVRQPFHDRITAEAGALGLSAYQRLRLRFDPIDVMRLRLVNLTGERIRLGAITAYESMDVRTEAVASLSDEDRGVKPVSRVPAD